MSTTAYRTNQKFIKAVETSGFVVEVIAESEHIEVKGNAMASGDDAYDAEVEAEIYRRLDNGDVWAWAAVTVKVTHPAWPETEGTDHLGACNYRDEAEFVGQLDGYYPDMVRSALDAWTDAAEATLSADAVAALGAAQKLLVR